MPGLPAFGWHRVPLPVCEPGNEETPAPSPPVTPRVPPHPPLGALPPLAPPGLRTAALALSPPCPPCPSSREHRQRATTLVTLVFFLSLSGQISAVERTTKSCEKEVFFLCFLFLPLCPSRLAPFHPPSTSLCCC